MREATHSVVVSLPVVLLLKLLGFELSKTAATGMVLLFTALSVRSEAAKKNGGKSEAVFGTPVKQPFEKKVKSYASAVKTDLAKTDMAEPNVAEPAMADPNMTKADNGFAGSATPAKFPKLTKEQKRELSEKARIAVGASPIREQDLAL